MLYQSIPGFLGNQLCDELLEYARVNQSSFEPTGVGTGSEVRTATRTSKRLTDLGRFRAVIEERVLPIVPAVVTSLQLTPFEPTGCEIELVAHEDGAFYHRHIDLFTDQERQSAKSDRLLSLVYYLFRQPRKFTGGELRLFSTPGIAATTQPEFVDVIPENDCAVIFSSWVPHEVRPIQCTSQAFGDARFAINCWVLRDRS